jgi:hypothetical protein
MSILIIRRAAFGIRRRSEPRKGAVDEGARWRRAGTWSGGVSAGSDSREIVEQIVGVTGCHRGIASAGRVQTTG